MISRMKIVYMKFQFFRWNFFIKEEFLFFPLPYLRGIWDRKKEIMKNFNLLSIQFLQLNRYNKKNEWNLKYSHLTFDEGCCSFGFIAYKFLFSALLLMRILSSYFPYTYSAETSQSFFTKILPFSSPPAEL